MSLKIALDLNRASFPIENAKSFAEITEATPMSAVV